MPKYCSSNSRIAIFSEDRLFLKISMTCQSFHQKYRPQTFAELVGQDAIAQTLTPAIAQPHALAYLFCGSRGTGKTVLQTFICPI
jgi:replication-associated recombination protein RarA